VPNGGRRAGQRAEGRRVRLDVALVERGLETSRERARRLILAGEVTVNGQVARAPSVLVGPDAEIAIARPMPYVSRGGLKLAHALDRFQIDVTGRVCLDAGSSTGGFTDVLLKRGARRVYAVDVGKGLLAWPLRRDPRVVVMEGVNVRYLRLAPRGPEPEARAMHLQGSPSPIPNLEHRRRTVATELRRAREGTAAPPAPSAPPGAFLPEPVGLATIDLAFISLRLVLPAITALLAEDGEVIALVKPQFEAGPAHVRKGIVRDPAIHRRVLQQVVQAARETGLHPAGLIASPIRGQAGNVEFFLWARRIPPAEPFNEPAAIDAALAEAPTAPSSQKA
jgi:23S rRNA (cytidine1920-2'-O)/16S rRNA (cytidine1409-2'-O)-methyltransferase